MLNISGGVSVNSTKNELQRLGEASPFQHHVGQAQVKSVSKIPRSSEKQVRRVMVAGSSVSHDTLGHTHLGRVSALNRVSS